MLREKTGRFAYHRLKYGFRPVRYDEWSYTFRLGYFNANPVKKCSNSDSSKRTTTIHIIHTYATCILNLNALCAGKCQSSLLSPDRSFCRTDAWNINVFPSKRTKMHDAIVKLFYFIYGCRNYGMNYRDIRGVKLERLLNTPLCVACKFLNMVKVGLDWCRCTLIMTIMCFIHCMYRFLC